MKDKLKVASAGYNLVVHSWENDADYKETITVPVSSLEQAEAFRQVCLYCGRDNLHTKGSIANEYQDFPDQAMLKAIAELQTQYHPYLGSDYDSFIAITNKLFGYSVEGYLSRVCSSFMLTYSESDLYIQIVPLN